MEHLQKRSVGRNAIDAVDIMSDMKQYFDEAVTIPVYINMMETAPKRLLTPSSPFPTTFWLPLLPRPSWCLIVSPAH